jgi:hypothetical protein
MAMQRKEVAVDFITRLKDKGFKDLDAATKKSQNSLKKFAKGLGATFSAVAIGAFVKKSIKEFNELDKATRRLQSELGNLGLAFATNLATDFTRNLALSTGISQDKLVPALQNLIQTTYTLTDAQKLLTLSTQISEQKGLDLEQVSKALSRAFVGDYNALVKLRIGYEAAELKGRKFEDLQKELEKDFSSKQPDTFANKISKLGVAFEQTQIAIGKGFIGGLEKSGIGVDELSKKMINLGEATGEAFGKAIGFVDKLINKVAEFNESQGGIKFIFRKDDAFLKDDPASGRAALRERNIEIQAKIRDQKKLAALEEDLRKQRAADLRKLQAEEKRRAAEKKRSADIDRLKNAISFKFDLDAINLQAALRRNLSKEDRDRALQLSALKISDYQTDEEAIKTLKAATEGRYNDAMNLEKVLQLLKTAGFAADKASIDALAALKPDIKFTDNLDDIIAKLKAIIEGKYNININVGINGAGGVVTGGGVTGGGVTGGGLIIEEGTGESGTGTGGSIGITPIVITTGDAAIIDTINAIIDNQNTLTASFLASLPSGLDANDLAAARYELQSRTITAENQLTNYLSGARYQMMANDITAQNTMTNQLAADRYTAMQNYYTRGSEPVVVNVNIEGSLLSQNDLVAAVTDAVYQTQRTGNDLIVSGI